MKLDVVTIGRSSVDLYGAQVGGRLEDMRSFNKYIGGSPTNIAAGCARLGLKSALITRVGDEHMGRFIREELAAEGVDVRSVITDPERLTALVLLGIRDDTHFPLIFYRENCADMALCEDDIDPDLIRDTRCLTVTGTHLSHDKTEAAVLKALHLARKYGARTALDIDYRPNLWGLAGHGAGEERFIDSPVVTARLQKTLALFDLIVGTEEEFHIAGGTTDTVQALKNVRALTAAALAHVNRLPVLLIPGDVFANRGPDPVLQQVEDFSDGTVSANDCFKPVSRYFDRITRPEQLITALPRAFHTLTDPAICGPVTLAFCQDVQAEAYDFPASMFEKKIWYIRRPAPDAGELARAVAALKAAKNPVIVAGGGVHYARACDALRQFAEAHNIPVVETQAGKSALPWDHVLNFGPVGVTGADSANAICADADLVFGIGTRFQDFTTGSWSLFKNPDRKILALNVQPYDSIKHGALSLVADARVGLEMLGAKLGVYRAADRAQTLRSNWYAVVDAVTAPPTDSNALPTDMQVIGAVQRAATENTVVMCAAGTMPDELHKLWKATTPGSYHMEYGFSCMGYEIAGAMGIKMANPSHDVICFTGDGTYMMANSELATAVMMGIDFTLIITDNRGFGCINRLQLGTGGAEFNNLLDHARHKTPSAIDFVKHSASMGAISQKVSSIAELEQALAKRTGKGVEVFVLDTDPYPSTEAGSCWWEVAVPEVSTRTGVNQARAAYEAALKERNNT